MAGKRRIIALFGLAFGLGGCAAATTGASAGTGPDTAPQVVGEPYTETIPGTTTGLEMVPISSGRVELETPDGPREVEVGPFYMSRTEIPWEIFDVWVFVLDEGAQVASGKDDDAASRPSRPYVLPGRNWGTDGRPALAMTFHAANVFAEWLSDHTGHTYRLPTQAEWVYACRAGGDAPQDLDAVAWYFQNSNDQTHPGGTKEENAFGLADMLGNVGEWVVGVDGEPVLMGGSFIDSANQLGCDVGKTQTPDWNMTDPQLPKSPWWLSDAPFVGLRLVREP